MTNINQKFKNRSLVSLVLILLCFTQISCTDKEKNVQNGKFSGSAFYNPYENSILYFTSNYSVSYMIYDGYPRNDNLILQNEYPCQINSNNSVHLQKLGMLENLDLELTTSGNNIGLTNTKFGKGWIFQKDFSESLSK